jgi:hypothetical protein
MCAGFLPLRFVKEQIFSRALGQELGGANRIPRLTGIV